MPNSIASLSSKILESNSFRNRFKELQNFAARERQDLSQEEFDSGQINKLILQASVLALSAEIPHKRIAQKINSLFHEIKRDDVLVSYAIQVISSRLGNFPVISEELDVFGEDSLFKKLNQGSDVSQFYAFDPEIIGSLYTEEEESLFQIGAKKYYFNIFQKEIMEELSSKSLVSFSAPTSFGKSFIVRHHIANLYVNNQLERVLIIVPTKALIDDFFEGIAKIKKDLNLEFAIYTHTRSVESAREKSVFILTQERLSFLINKTPDFLPTFQLVYCDEAHYISRGYRGFVLRDVLRKVVALCGIAGQGGNTKYIFSSPIIKNPQYYKEKIFPALNENLSFHKEVKYSPVEKNLHFIVKGSTDYRLCLLRDPVDGDAFEERLEDVSLKPFPLLLQSEDPLKEKIPRDIHIVLNSNLTERTILYTTSPLMAHRYAIELAHNLPDRNLIAQEELDDLDKYIKDHYDASFGLIDLIKKGVGLHYGPMPIGLRRAIVELFEHGRIDYLVCTSTLLEGVNLPAKNIFIFSDNYVGKTKHTALSFWNLIGRAGRITHGLSGNVFCIEQQPQKYKKLVEDAESEIKDPEVEVAENDTRRSYIIQAFTDPDKNFAYIRSQNRNDIEYLIFELLTRERPEYILNNFHISEDVRNKILEAIEIQKNAFTIPINLVHKNPGIDPRLQNNLYTFIDGVSLSEMQNILWLASNSFITGKKLLEILTATAKYLKWPQEESAGRIARRLTQWLYENPISLFIQQVLRHHEGGNSRELYFKRVASAITIIKTIETNLSYNCPKYLKCFFDIAMYGAKIKGIQDIDTQREKIEAFLFGLEAGISSPVAKFLFEKGVSRTIAIKVNSLLGETSPSEITTVFFNQSEIHEVLKGGLSRIAFKELEAHLKE